MSEPSEGGVYVAGKVRLPLTLISLPSEVCEWLAKESVDPHEVVHPPTRRFIRIPAPGVGVIKELCDDLGCTLADVNCQNPCISFFL